LSNFAFNISLGRIVEFYNRVDTNDPSASTLVLVVLRTTGLASDATLKDLDTLAQVLSASPEVANTGYARKVYTDADLAAFTTDDTNDRNALVVANAVWTGVQAGDGWSKLLMCYSPSAGADSTIIPMLAWDFVVVPDGTDLSAVVPGAGFLWAT
jgi:hypothetical protein